MPELEQLIAQWRRGLLETTGCSAEVLDELESHLRDEIQQLVATGHTPEQALTLAAARLGNPRTLGAEFAKVAGPAPWLPVRVATLGAIVLAAMLVGYLLGRCQDGRLTLLLAAHVGAVTLGYSTSLLVGLLAFCYVAIRPFRAPSPGQMQSASRAVFLLTSAALALNLVGIVLGAAWANEHLGRYWGWDPKESGAACVVAWQMAVLLLFRYQVSERLLILLGFVGNVVVGVAWFGTAGAPPFLAGVALFSAIQFVLFGVGCIPAGRLRSRGA
jgi:hypothetical protein